MPPLARIAAASVAGLLLALAGCHKAPAPAGNHAAGQPVLPGSISDALPDLDGGTTQPPLAGRAAHAEPASDTAPDGEASDAPPPPDSAPDQAATSASSSAG